VQACRRHPLARALRIDKLRIAALEATLESLMVGDDEDIPTWAMLRATSDDLRRRAEAVAAAVGGRVVPTAAMVGAGSAPGRTLESFGVALEGEPHRQAQRLRAGTPPVIGRVIDDAIVLDLRSVLPDDDDELVAAIRALGSTD
jgi:L-seryl-tRNA(Ser) seleniumtransferase